MTPAIFMSSVLTSFSCMERIKEMPRVLHARSLARFATHWVEVLIWHGHPAHLKNQVTEHSVLNNELAIVASYCCLIDFLLPDM
ncbi:unnamed protein product [Urochloa humidicola]